MSEKAATVLVIVSLALLFTAIVLERHVKGIDREFGLYKDSGFLSSVFTGFKKFVARECWIQADIYLHQGLIHEYDEEHGEEHDLLSMPHNEEQHHHKSVKPHPLKPYNREDFSTIQHKTDLDDRDILPWLRLTAYMDPHLTKAYANGGHWLAWRLEETEQAIEFLEEGLKNNPGAPDILAEIGILYLDPHNTLGTRDYRKAFEALEEALKSERDAFNRVRLLTYFAECCNRLEQYENAIKAVDEKIAILLTNGMDDSDRLRRTVEFREELRNKVDSTGD
jgi:tetratricopeptide (TPR) repeat protein